MAWTRHINHSILHVYFIQWSHWLLSPHPAFDYIESMSIAVARFAFIIFYGEFHWMWMKIASYAGALVINHSFFIVCIFPCETIYLVGASLPAISDILDFHLDVFDNTLIWNVANFITHLDRERWQTPRHKNYNLSLTRCLDIRCVWKEIHMCKMCKTSCIDIDTGPTHYRSYDDRHTRSSWNVAKKSKKKNSYQKRLCWRTSVPSCRDAD